VRIASRVVVDAKKLTPLVNDPDAKVRLELASTLARIIHQLRRLRPF
jgi:hypothetical protein